MNRSVVEILKSIGGVITDSHFVYTSGKHGGIYINKDALYPHTQLTSEICQLMAEKTSQFEIDTVVGPAMGGIILAQWTAFHLSQMKGKEIFGVYAEKMADSTFAFTRGYKEYVTGKNVLVVEDLTTTGQSAKKIVELVKANGGNVVAVGVMVNRNPDRVNSDLMGVPFVALDVLRAQEYDEADLPNEIKNLPINTTVGHGKKYLESKKA